MKRYLLWAVLLLTAGVLIFATGCSSPIAKAQKLYNEGKYEEVIAQYGSDPNVAAVVIQAKEKLAEKLLMEGKYAVVVEMYPETAAAKEARNKLAEQLFLQKHYAEVIAKYPETPWAAQAKIEMDKAAQGGGDNGGAKKPDQGGGGGGAGSEIEKAAQTEYERIMAIKMKDMRVKALREFVAKAQFAGTKAVAKAQAELGK